MEEDDRRAGIEMADVVDPDQVGSVDHPAVEHGLDVAGGVDRRHFEYLGPEEPDAVEAGEGVGAADLHHRRTGGGGEGGRHVGGDGRLADARRALEQDRCDVGVLQQTGDVVDRFLTPDEGPPSHGPQCTHRSGVARMGRCPPPSPRLTPRCCGPVVAPVSATGSSIRPGGSSSPPSSSGPVAAAEPY
ncbi:MAG: hypothetical protein V9G12_15920 [Microthrixaceae bacterium]